jgi:hypothetical protein
VASANSQTHQNQHGHNEADVEPDLQNSSPVQVVVEDP